MVTHNSTDNLKAWTKGQSGNPAGRTPGSRNAFSQGYIAAFSEVWREHGIEAVRSVAKKNPTAFVGIASKLIPQQVTATIEQQLPGNLSLDEWATLREIMQAIRTSMPQSALDQPVGAVLEFVKQAIEERLTQLVTSAE
jgi:hypothetical protein